MSKASRHTDEQDDEDDVGKYRIDKWLWAARFFRTRNLAKQAIEAGHVRYNGERCKVAKEVATGALLSIRQGWDEIEVEVLGLSDQRASAPIAQQLYRETEASQARRERAKLERQAAASSIIHERPTKKQRRQIHRFKRDGLF